jgi:hypothetical protein
MRARLNYFAKEALRIAGGKGELDKILSDIIEITCLVVSDGDECRFIHKSVQEYHAALFIQEQPDALAIAFYAAMESKWMAWKEELAFLEVIDRYRYLKYFQIKELQKLLDIGSGVLKDVITVELISKVCGKDRLTFRHVSSGGWIDSFTHVASGAFWPTLRLIYDSEYGADIFQVVKGRERLEGAVYEETVEGDSITIDQLLKIESVRKGIETSCSAFCECLQKELREAEDFVAHVESTKAVFQF